MKTLCLLLMTGLVGVSCGMQAIAGGSQSQQDVSLTPLPQNSSRVSVSTDESGGIISVSISLRSL